MTFEAVLLLGVVLVLTQTVKKIVPNLPSWATPLVAMAIGVASVFLVGETDWADQQIVSDLTLDSLNGWSKLVAGIMLGGGAGLATETLRAVGNVGENTSKPPVD
jgi:hypothetical protein